MKERINRAIYGIKSQSARILGKCLKKVNNPYVRKNPEALKWGIIGTGHMGKVFARTLNRCRDDIAYAVLSRTESKASEFGNNFHIARCYTDLTEFLADTEIDIVYIATPLETHYSYIEATLKARKNVLCEKPFVQCEAQVEALAHIARENQCLLMEGMWSRMLPTYVQAQKWIEEGRIGDIELIRVEKARQRNYTRTDKSALEQSAIWDYGIYPISFVQLFLKKPAIISVDTTFNSNGIDTDWHIIMEENGVKAYVDISGRYPGASKAYIAGTKGTIEIAGQFNRSNRVSLHNLSGKTEEFIEFKYESEGFEYEISEVNRLIREGALESPAINLQDTRQGIRIINELTGLQKGAACHNRVNCDSKKIR